MSTELKNEFDSQPLNVVKTTEQLSDVNFQDLQRSIEDCIVSHPISGHWYYRNLKIRTNCYQDELDRRVNMGLINTLYMEYMDETEKEE
jgi:hypothetical protein